MAQREIVTPPHPVLRQKSRPVTDFGFELQKLIDDMIETMRDGQGVGLAANQVAIPAQVIVVEMPLPNPDAPQEEPPPPYAGELFTLVNPKIAWRSREKVDGIEGCLSLPGIVGEVERHQEVRVRGQDRQGKKVNLRFEGWMARIFQHEIDHLKGVLFTDHIDDPEKIWQVTPGEEEIIEAEAAGYRFSI